MEVSFYSQAELNSIGFKKIGNNVKISRKCSFYSPEKMEIGNNVRIDDFCILSGEIKIGDYVHINGFSILCAGNAGIDLMDFCNISHKVAIYAVSDDYSGEWMTSPLLPEKYTNILRKKVVLGKHVIVGSGSTILPGCTIGDGVSIGAMSLVKRDLDSWGIYAGIPAKFIKSREKKILDLEKEFYSEEV